MVTVVKSPEDHGVGEDDPEHGEDAHAVQTVHVVRLVPRGQQTPDTGRQGEGRHGSQP